MSPEEFWQIAYLVALHQTGSSEEAAKAACVAVNDLENYRNRSRQEQGLRRMD